jgi:hypothetical protein
MDTLAIVHCNALSRISNRSTTWCRSTRAHPGWVEPGCALDSLIGACPFRKTGVHFSGTCARAGWFSGSFLSDLARLTAKKTGPRKPGNVSIWGRVSWYSVICQPTINAALRSGEGLSTSSREWAGNSGSVFGIDRPNPFIAARARTNGILNCLVFHAPGSPLIRIWHQSVTRGLRTSDRDPREDPRSR